jgi:hypothetical protein
LSTAGQIGSLGKSTFFHKRHRFAQIFQDNLIDAEFQNIYLPRQIEPGSLETYGSARGCESLTADAIRRGTGKLKDFAIQQGGRKSLAAIAMPGWIRKLGEVAVRFRGCDGLTAVAMLRRMRNLGGFAVWLGCREGLTAFAAPG